MELDVKDRKILYHLSKNARLTNREIGKAIGLHKDTVGYRLKQLTDQGVISGHTMFFDFGKLGFQVYKAYFKFKGVGAEKIREMANELKDDKMIGWIVLCNGRWDMILGFLCKSNARFFEKKQELERKFHDSIGELKVSAHVQAFFYPRNYLVPESPSEEMRIFGEGEAAKVDGKDIAILNLLGSDARMSVVEIARKTHLTPRIVAYRIRAMRKGGIILQYRSSINLEKVNYIFVKAFIRLQDMTPESRRKILEYCKIHPNIVHNVICLGDWDLEPEFEVRSIEEFYCIISEMRDMFSGNIRDIESAIINREIKYQYLVPLDKF